MVIDLGCGEAKVTGAVGVDNVDLPSVDVVHDLLQFPYPFEDESAETIYLNHVIEHFILNDTQAILAECHRILQPHGELIIRVPHVFCVAAWVDITHKQAFTFGSASFWDARSGKRYYRETQNSWHSTRTTTRVTLFNWKRYRLRQLDNLLSRGLASVIDFLLKQESWPGGADLLVKVLPVFFVEIGWHMQKVQVA